MGLAAMPTTLGDAEPDLMRVLGTIPKLSPTPRMASSLCEIIVLCYEKHSKYLTQGTDPNFIKLESQRGFCLRFVLALCQDSSGVW